MNSEYQDYVDYCKGLGRNDCPCQPQGELK